MVKALNIIYECSDTLVAQGKNVSKQKRNGFYEVHGGNGSYRMAKPSKAILEFEVDGKRHSSSVKDLIREAYSISRVGEKQATRFLSDVQSGKIELDYSDETGLRLV